VLFIVTYLCHNNLYPFENKNLLLLAAFSIFQANAQKTLSVSGKITDAKNGEELIGASVSISSLKTGTTTNSYGFYSLTIPEGTHEVEFSYLGYISQKKTIVLNQNQKISIELQESKKELNELVVKTDRLNNDNVSQTK
jgi:hypothetical protein